jgi:hypothetical protein
MYDEESEATYSDMRADYYREAGYDIANGGELYDLPDEALREMAANGDEVATRMLLPLLPPNEDPDRLPFE